MVGMIVVWAWPNHKVCVPLANETDQFLSRFKCGQQFAIVNVQNLNGDSEHPIGFFHFLFPSQRQRTTCFTPMTDVAVSHGNELDMVTFSSPKSARSRGLQFAIIRMRAKSDDSEFVIAGYSLSTEGGCK